MPLDPRKRAARCHRWNYRAGTQRAPAGTQPAPVAPIQYPGTQRARARLAVRPLGVLGQEAHQQQGEQVQACGDAKDKFCGGEVGMGGRVPGAGEEHRAECGDADGAGELLDRVEHACAGAGFFGGGIAEDEVEQRDEQQPGAEAGE